MLARLVAYARGIARRRPINTEVEDELQVHLEHEVQAHVAREVSTVESETDGAARPWWPAADDRSDA